jgi:hypothetical protein
LFLWVAKLFAAIIACPLYSMDYHTCYVGFAFDCTICFVLLKHCIIVFSSITLGGAITFALTLFMYCFHLCDVKNGMCMLFEHLSCVIFASAVFS